MTEKTPPSRPALRKSVDATVHPALAGRTVAGSIGTSASRGTAASQAVPAPPPPTRPPLRKSQRAATSDAVRPTKKDPAVKVTVEMPKSLRKRLRKQAEQRGLAPELLAAQFIAEGLQGD